MRIDHVNIVVQDLAAAKQFFIELGFTLLAEKDLEGSWIDNVVQLPNVQATFCALKLPEDDIVLELITYHSPRSPQPTEKSEAHQLGFRHMAFQVQDIDGIYNQLQQKGIHCFSPVTDVPGFRGKRLFYFQGPEGIILECAQYGCS